METKSRKTTIFVLIIALLIVVKTLLAIWFFVIEHDVNCFRIYSTMEEVHPNIEMTVSLDRKGRHANVQLINHSFEYSYSFGLPFSLFVKNNEQWEAVPVKETFLFGFHLLHLPHNSYYELAYDYYIIFGNLLPAGDYRKVMYFRRATLSEGEQHSAIAVRFSIPD